jgi:hypothetical protein
MTIKLNGSDLTVTQVVAAARHGEAVVLAPGQLGLGTGHAFRMIRELVPFTRADGTLPADLEPLVEPVSRGDPTPAA